MLVKSLLGGMFVFVGLAITTTVFSQKIGGGDSYSAGEIRVKRAAILPMLFFREDKVAKNEKAIKACTDVVDAVFKKYGVDPVDLPHVNVAWQKVTGQRFDEKQYQLPKAEDLVALGHELGVDYVVFSRCKWHVKSVWVGLGPKTKAEATVDFWIVDTQNSEFCLKSDGIFADDTKKEETVGIAVDIFVGPMTVFSGGAETPRMQQAGQSAFAKALEPWTQKQNKTKIGG